nr:unnamed protein product [Digitaria exilis]
MLPDVELLLASKSGLDIDRLSSLDIRHLSSVAVCCCCLTPYLMNHAGLGQIHAQGSTESSRARREASENDNCRDCLMNKHNINHPSVEPVHHTQVLGFGGQCYKIGENDHDWRFRFVPRSSANR